MKRPPMTLAGRDWLFVLWFVLTALLVVAVSAGSRLDSAPSSEGRGEARRVDMERLLRRIERGQLSREPARHWTKIGERSETQRGSRSLGKRPAPAAGSPR